jgi:hypothetical protein
MLFVSLPKNILVKAKIPWDVLLFTEEKQEKTS